MRMYELWKIKKNDGEAQRLEDAGGPVLFVRACDADNYFCCDPERWEAECRIMSVTVGVA